MKRALISVYNKDKIVDVAKKLVEKGYEILSTGGTYNVLKENNIDVIEVSSYTNFPEMMDGRVKTLHPKIHGALLGREVDLEIMEKHGINKIDLVIVNLYPFFEKPSIETIDIGGPSMLRSAAKNYERVVVISDIEDYSILDRDEIDLETRKYLASKVFKLTSDFDREVYKFLSNNIELRYGENPHQKAKFYQSEKIPYEKLNGKELSFNNIRDMEVAYRLVCEFDEPVVCALKHQSPCGVAKADNIYDAYIKAYNADSMSIFGGIVALNRKLEKNLAEKLVEIFLEIVIAPEISDEALEILKTKKNLRVLKWPIDSKFPEEEIYRVSGGYLTQEVDNIKNFETNCVTEKKPSKEELEDLIFGMKLIKYVKSNAIVTVKNGVTLGFGNGQTNRYWATEHACKNVKGDFVLISDAFFPFRDCVDYAVSKGVKAIIQPGGSLRDKESIDACNEAGISMVFTGYRHFKH